MAPGTDPDRSFELVGPAPLSALEALDLAYLTLILRRWHRVLDVCSGDRAHALRVWRAAHLADARERDADQQLDLTTT